MVNVNKHCMVLVKVCECGSHINKKLSKEEKKYHTIGKKKLDKFALLKKTRLVRVFFLLWTKLPF